jgi:iron complex transport system substrate-binding protein
MPALPRLIKTRCRSWLLLASLTALCACSPPGRVQPRGGGAEGVRHLTDEIGRQVAVRRDPRRVVSLAPSLTETLFALGLGDKVVGVTSYCDYPAEAHGKEKVGDTLRPNLERLIALKPDLVLITTSSQLESLTRQLDQLSIPIYVTNPRTVVGVIESIRQLGEVAGAGARAAEVAAAMERRVDEVRRRVAGGPGPRVLYVLQNSPLITAGRDTFISDLIRLAGGESISGAESADYPQFSREAVIARAPEVIIIPASHGTELVDEDAVRRDFAATPAVRENRLVRINPDWVDRPGPRLVAGLEAVARALHPQAVK